MAKEVMNNTAAPEVKDHRYEALYTELLDRGDQLHEANKRRIRRGIVFLIILPVILDAIRLMTDSDKVVFLIIWIIIMFVMSAYLISIEYLDSAIENTLQDVTDTEADFDGLVPKPGLPVGDLHERIRERLGELRPDNPEGEEQALAADAIALTHMDERETQVTDAAEEADDSTAHGKEDE